MKDNKYNYRNQTGMYRNRVGIYTTQIRQDDILQDIEEEVLFANYWAMIKANRNINQLQADTESTEGQIRFVFRYAKSLDDFIRVNETNFTLKHKGITYKVKEAFNDNELNENITIYVEDVI